MMNFVKSLAKKLGPKDARAKGVAPGPVWTPLQISSGAADGQGVPPGATTVTAIQIFTSAVAMDIDRRGRWRWTIFENRKARDKSFGCFGTRYEAQADADKFIEKLTTTWRSAG